MTDSYKRASYTLRELEVGFAQTIDEVELRNVSLEVLRDDFQNAVTVAVRGFVWAEEKAVRIVEMQMPETGWQVIKRSLYRARWIPRCIRRRAEKRWPVLYERHVVDVGAIYPEFEHEVPKDFGRQILVACDKGKTRDSFDPEEC